MEYGFVEYDDIKENILISTFNYKQDTPLIYGAISMLFFGIPLVYCYITTGLVFILLLVIICFYCFAVGMLIVGIKNKKNNKINIELLKQQECITSIIKGRYIDFGYSSDTKHKYYRLILHDELNDKYYSSNNAYTSLHSFVINTQMKIYLKDDKYFYVDDIEYKKRRKGK